MHQISEEKLEQTLSKIEFKENISKEHKHELRRALLNSSFYDTSKEKTFSFFYWKFSPQKAGISVFVFLLIFGISFMLLQNDKNQKIALEKEQEKILAITKNKDSEKINSILRDLQNAGKVEFVESADDNTRIYKVKLTDTESFDVYDKAPYTIDLVGANY